MGKSELSALISLLDDPDEDIYEQIKYKLIEYGEEIIPELENAWEYEGFGHLFQNRIEEIIHFIQFQNIIDLLTEWNESKSFNLLQGMLIINQYQYPDLDRDKVDNFIELLRKDVWLELNDNLTALEKVQVMNHIIFEVHGIAGNTKNYQAPQNSFLTDIIDTKKGNPICLAIIYMIVAQQLNLPIYGVNLPNHFVLAYLDEHDNPHSKNQSVLFYINAFSRGIAFNKKEIDQFLAQIKVKPEAKYFGPCSNKDILKRVLTNLIISYDKLGYLDKVNELKILKELID